MGISQNDPCSLDLCKDLGSILGNHVFTEYGHFCICILPHRDPEALVLIVPQIVHLE